MTAEIRVDRITSRTGINTISFTGDGFSFLTNVGIGTTNIDVAVNAANTQKLNVGIITANDVFATNFYVGGNSLTSGVGIQSAGNLVGYGFTTLNFIGAGNTFSTSGTTVNVSIAGGGGSGTEVDTIVQSINPTGVGSFATATHRSASIIAQINQNANYQVGRYLMIHDNTTVTLVEESAIATGSMLGSFTGAISGANAEIQVTMVSAGIATITTKIDTTTI
jgi:hypothetical protein